MSDINYENKIKEEEEEEEVTKILCENISNIKITRNIFAGSMMKADKPLSHPKSDVLYVFDITNWENKNAFYEKIECSFGVPSTQKQVFCNYLNKKVMHYERTCQGVYYCPYAEDCEKEGKSYDKEEVAKCSIKTCRYRFHTCEVHGLQLKKSKSNCKHKLHFYIPLDKNDNTRLLLCRSEHNHIMFNDKNERVEEQEDKTEKVEDKKNMKFQINFNNSYKPNLGYESYSLNIPKILNNSNNNSPRSFVSNSNNSSPRSILNNSNNNSPREYVSSNYSFVSPRTHYMNHNSNNNSPRSFTGNSNNSSPRDSNYIPISPRKRGFDELEKNDFLNNKSQKIEIKKETTTFIEIKKEETEEDLTLPEINFDKINFETNETKEYFNNNPFELKQKVQLPSINSLLFDFKKF